MSNEPELKARDKVVLRMTREGAIEENLTAAIFNLLKRINIHILAIKQVSRMLSAQSCRDFSTI